MLEKWGVPFNIVTIIDKRDPSHLIDIPMAYQEETKLADPTPSESNLGNIFQFVHRPDEDRICDLCACKINDVNEEYEKMTKEIYYLRQENAMLASDNNSLRKIIDVQDQENGRQKRNYKTTATELQREQERNLRLITASNTAQKNYLRLVEEVQKRDKILKKLIQSCNMQDEVVYEARTLMQAPPTKLEF